jgi:predicted alpha/beta-fold hydrolase
LHEPQNRIYEQKFVRALLKRFRRKAGLFPRAFDPHRTAQITSLREFDERITALYCGFRSADDYYHQAAAARVLPAIRIPTLILHAQDDPFVRLTAETRSAIVGNPKITFLETEHGGHCAFLAKADRSTGDDGYWAEHTALRFVLAHA